MPIERIEVTEYTCIKCSYRWINRINGKDGTEPQRCAKCKRTNWNKGSPTPEQVGLRRRICSLEKIYSYLIWYSSGCKTGEYDKSFNWPKGLIEKFLNIDPTITELKQVLFVGKLKLNSQNQYRRRGWVDNPDKKGWLKYDFEAYQKLLGEDAQKQQELMQQIIESRKN